MLIYFSDTSEYPGITSKKIRKLLNEQQLQKPSSSRSTSPQEDSDEDTPEEHDTITKELDPSRYFKNQCKKLYDLIVKLYREDGIHALAYCVPPTEQTHVRPLKVFNTKLCKRFHEKLLDENIKISDDLRDYIVDNTSPKKKKQSPIKEEKKIPAKKRRTLVKEEDEMPAKKKRSLLKEEEEPIKKTKISKLPSKVVKVEVRPQGKKKGKYLKMKRQLKLDNFLKQEGDELDEKQYVDPRNAAKKEIRKRMKNLLLNAAPELDSCKFPWKAFGTTGRHKTCVIEGLKENDVDLGKGIDRLTTRELYALITGIDNGSITIRKL
ncbi:unnamed protein product [Rhizopus stolonifer]